MRAPVSQDCWALSQIAAFGKGAQRVAGERTECVIHMTTAANGGLEPKKSDAALCMNVGFGAINRDHPDWL
jgi:hypothetical protein